MLLTGGAAVTLKTAPTFLVSRKSPPKAENSIDIFFYTTAYSDRGFRFCKLAKTKSQSLLLLSQAFPCPTFTPPFCQLALLSTVLHPSLFLDLFVWQQKHLDRPFLYQYSTSTGKANTGIASHTVRQTRDGCREGQNIGNRKKFSTKYVNKAEANSNRIQQRSARPEA